MGSNPPYVVIRLVPESPVDDTTFATYLDGLTLQLIDANTLQPRSDLAYSSPLNLSGWPDASGWWRLELPPENNYSGHDRATEFNADGAWPGYFCSPADLRESPLGPLRDARCGPPAPGPEG